MFRLRRKPPPRPLSSWDRYLAEQAERDAARAAPEPPPHHSEGQTSRDVLLAELDRLARGGNRFATNYAANIRREGQPALTGAINKCAADVLSSRSWLDSTAVIAAFAAYDKAVSGRDWHLIPHELTRARMAQVAAEDRWNAAQARARDAARARAERVGARALASLQRNS